MSKATPPGRIDRHRFFILHDRKLDEPFCKAMDIKNYQSKFDETSNRFCTMIYTVRSMSERDLHTLLTRYVEKTPEPRVKLFPFLSAKIFETKLRGGLQPPHPIFEEIMTAKYLHPHLYHEWGSFDTAPTPEPSPKKRAAVDMPEPKKRPAVEMSGGAWPSNLQPAEPARTLALLSTAAPVVCLDSPPETPSVAPPAASRFPKPSVAPAAPPPLRLSSPPRRPLPSPASIPPPRLVPKRPQVVCARAPQPTLAINCYDMLRLQDDYIQALQATLRSKDQTIAAQAKLLEFMASRGAAGAGK